MNSHFMRSVVRSTHPVATLESVVELLIDHHAGVGGSPESKQLPHEDSI